MMWDGGDLIAAAALLLSAISVVLTVHSNHRQNEFDATAERLNTALIEREARETENMSKADLSADFVESGRRQYKFRVYNKGKADALNVRLKVLEGEELLMRSEVKSRFPIAKLEPHAKVNIITTPAMGRTTQVKVKLIWDDEAGSGHEVELTRNVY